MPQPPAQKMWVCSRSSLPSAPAGEAQTCPSSHQAPKRAGHPRGTESAHFTEEETEARGRLGQALRLTLGSTKFSPASRPFSRQDSRDSPSGPVVKKGSAPSAGAWVRSPAREPDSVCHSEDPASAQTLCTATNTRHSQIKKVKIPEREATVREEDDPEGDSEAELPQCR